MDLARMMVSASIQLSKMKNPGFRQFLEATASSLFLGGHLDQGHGEGDQREAAEDQA